jgi:hypothetical protein
MTTEERVAPFGSRSTSENVAMGRGGALLC